MAGNAVIGALRMTLGLDTASLETGPEWRAIDLVEGLPIGRASEMLNVGERSVARARPTLNAAYRAGAAFVMNSTTAGQISKLKDLQNRPLWQPSMQEGSNEVLRSAASLWRAAEQRRSEVPEAALSG